MPDLDVRASGEHTFDFTLTTDDGTETEHRLTVPEPYLDDVAGENADEATAVRCAVELMVEHDVPRIPRQFSLADVEGWHPGFDDLLRAALRP